MTMQENQIGRKTTYTFDAAGQTATRRFPNGDVTTYSYDNNGRETGRQYFDGSRVTLAYDAVGNLTTMSDSTGVTTYSYDTVSQLTGKTDPGPLVQAYTYDLAGQRTTLKDPDNGVRTFTYDTLSRLSTTQMPSGKYTTFQYDLVGRETTVTYGGSGAVVTTTYDAVGNVLEVEGARWSYDLMGNPLTELSIKGDPRTFTYDALDRISGYIGTVPWGTRVRTYTYDAVGNITENTETGPVTYAYDLASQMTLMMFHGARITQVYDTNGNLTGILRTSLAPVTMVYDKENREIASRQGESVVSYTYSGDGLKRSELAEESRTTLIWDGSEYLGEITGKP